MSEWAGAVVRIGDNVAWTSVEGRIVAMALARQDAVPFVLEESAAAIWDEVAAAGPILVGRLVENVADVFEIDHGDIRADLETLLGDLVAQGLLAI